MKLSIIMPVYNELGTIADIIQRVRAVEVKVPVGYGPEDGSIVELEREIVVVDDGSTDGTRRILRNLADRLGVTVIFHERNQGKGAAVRTGIEHASGDVVLIQDADLEYDPRDYPALSRRADQGHVLLAYARQPFPHIGHQRSV
jgi:glycosyltransferase involved in cell wall biosynthesis